MANILLSKWIFLLLATALAGRVAAQAEPSCKAHNTRLPHANDCTKYYLCMLNPANGTYARSLQTCPPSLKFSVESQGCSSNSSCDTLPPACGTNPFACITTSSYQVCVDGNAAGAAIECPSGTQCDAGCSIPCNPRPCPLIPCTAPGLNGVPGDCTRYAFCFPNSAGVLEPTLGTCPRGRFDVSLKICTEAAIVKCA